MMHFFSNNINWISWTLWAISWVSWGIYILRYTNSGKEVGNWLLMLSDPRSFPKKYLWIIFILLWVYILLWPISFFKWFSNIIVSMLIKIIGEE